MALRRAFLLILGLAGSFVAAGALYISAETAQVMAQQPELMPAPTQGTVSLPAGVPGTALIAYRMSAYDGPFLEDGSDREVFSVAALLIYNGGSKTLQSVRIQLAYPDLTYTFTGDHIPPASWVILLEDRGSPYRDDIPVSCAGWQSVLFEQWDGPLLIEDTTLGMRICNTGKQPLENIRISYKTWLSDPGIYIGGITYHFTIPRLEAGESVGLQPGHYAPGHSKVVSISGCK